jgi:hypothetical protein
MRMFVSTLERPMIMAATAATAVALAAGLLLPVPAYLGLIAVVFLLALGAVALSVQLETPFLGLAVLVVTAVVFPVEFRGPAGVMMSSSFPLAAILCGLWILRVAISRGSSGLDGSRAVYAILAFIAVTLLSFAMGQFPWFATGGAPLPAQVAELGLFLLSAGLFLVVGHQLKSLAQLKWLTWMVIGAGAITTVLQMLPQLRFLARLTTRPGSVGSLFWTWLVALSVAQLVFNRSLSLATRVFLVGINVLVFYHGLFQVRSWASGWVPPLVVLGTIVLVRLPRLTVGVTLVAVPLAALMSGPLLQFLLGDEEYSLMTRQEAWAVLWQLFERSPLLGTGPANYYYFTENFPILGWHVRFISHNNYQDLLIQTGILGLLAFLWFSVEMFLMARRVYRQVPPGFPRAYLVGAVAGLAGSLVAGMLGDWIVPFYYNAGILGFRSSLLFWVFLGGVLALKRMVPRHGEAEAPVVRQSDLRARASREPLRAY